ncbi:hypothetical protein ACFV4K_00295 [Nocardia sp. NPDC059764]|uniref:hypothetical protein n=1 Tax=Nocardia sp. NPDC059764 TaxID=3346939 RepID=UPI00364C148E
MTVIEKTAARELTDRIRAGAEALWQLIAQAYVDRVWASLGYGSWDDYCTKEFEGCRIKLPREERHEVVGSMREVGMSLRAIAAATGLSKGTIQNDLAAGGQDCPPDSVVGSDGKTYHTKPIEHEQIPVLDAGDPLEGALDDTEPSTRRRRPIAEAFDTVRYDLLKRAESLARLAADDRFERNAEQLARRYRFDLVQARDAIQAVIDRMPNLEPDSQEA